MNMGLGEDHSPSWKSVLCGCFGAVSTKSWVQFPATSIFVIRAVHINTISWSGCPGHHRMLPTWVFSSWCPPGPWSVMPSWVSLALKWTSLFQHCPSRLISSRRAQPICHPVWGFSPSPYAIPSMSSGQHLAVKFFPSRICLESRPCFPDTLPTQADWLWGPLGALPASHLNPLISIFKLLWITKIIQARVRLHTLRNVC